MIANWRGYVLPRCSKLLEKGHFSSLETILGGTCAHQAGAAVYTGLIVRKRRSSGYRADQLTETGFWSIQCCAPLTHCNFSLLPCFSWPRTGVCHSLVLLTRATDVPGLSFPSLRLTIHLLAVCACSDIFSRPERTRGGSLRPSLTPLFLLSIIRVLFFLQTSCNIHEYERCAE